MPSSPTDRLYMRAAERLAAEGLFSVTRNNPRVGCLIVKDAEVVGRGWHETDGGAHAEVNALEDAGEKAKGATAYVSVEPCCFEGRTGACTEALAQRGISRVVIGASDFHPKVRGKGVERLKQLGLTVKLMGSPADNTLNVGCRYRHRRNRPYVRVKVATSLDGRTAMANGESQWITGDPARKDVQYWRARSGAIITGIGTVLADNPRFTVREPMYQGCIPWRVVLDTQGRFPESSAMFSEEGRVIVVCGSEVSEDWTPSSGVDVWREEEPTINFNAVLHRLAAEGVNEVLVEAGSRLTATVLERNLWDELIVYLAPKLLGKDARPLAELGIQSLAESLNGQVESIEGFGNDLRLILTPSRTQANS